MLLIPLAITYEIGNAIMFGTHIRHFGCLENVNIPLLQSVYHYFIGTMTARGLVLDALQVKPGASLIYVVYCSCQQTT